MSTESTSRWTARGALGFSIIALGVSLYAAGCRKPDSAPTRESVSAAPLETQTQAVAAPSAAKPAPTAAPAAEQKPEPKRAELPPSSSDEVSVNRLVVTTGIEKREPVVGSEFVAGESDVVAFVELKNGAAASGKVLITFEPASGGASVGFIPLKVPAKQSRWRTWGKTQMVKAPGTWSAVVHDHNGKELARQSFEVKPAPKSQS